MKPEQIQGYIQIGVILVEMGVEIGGKVKAIIRQLHPEQTLTDEQLNAIEETSMLQAKARRSERLAMGMPST